MSWRDVKSVGKHGVIKMQLADTGTPWAVYMTRDDALDLVKEILDTIQNDLRHEADNVISLADHREPDPDDGWDWIP